MRLNEIAEHMAVRKSALLSSMWVRPDGLLASPRTTGSSIMKAVMLHMTGMEMRYPAAPLTSSLLLASLDRSETILSRLPVLRRYSASTAPPSITRAREENILARPEDM